MTMSVVIGLQPLDPPPSCQRMIVRTSHVPVLGKKIDMLYACVEARSAHWPPS